MTKKNNIIQLIKTKKTEYSPKQKKIVSYLLKNYQKAAFLTATQLAREIGVSQPTVIRFAQHLGFSNYNYFTMAFQDIVTSELTSTERLSINIKDQSIKEGDFDIIGREIRTLELFAKSFPHNGFQQIIEQISKSNEIYIVGTRASASLAQYFAYFLGKVKKRVYPITNGSTTEYDRLISLDDRALVIALAFPRYPRETLEIIRFCKSRGINVAGITDKVKSPLAKLSNTLIIVPITFCTIFDSYSSVLCLFSMIVNKIARIDSNKSEVLIEEFEKLANTIKIFH